MHEASLYTRTDEGDCICGVCPHGCRIAEERTGICKVRKNVGGRLYALNYGKVAAEAIDPIEKKPLNHFLPGTYSYSIGGIGCNFHCKHCQNWHISQADLDSGIYREIPPEVIVEKAKKSGCRSVSITYNEPTIWHEYSMDIGRLAGKEGLKMVYVTNGYITAEALTQLGDVLHAYRVDLKSFSDSFYKTICGGRLQPVLDAAVTARGLGMHIETVTLIIPGINDSTEETGRMISWVIDNLGPDTPMHFTRFHPDYRMTDRGPTPVETLERIYGQAKDLGLSYPYIGNVAGHKYENTYCPSCGNLLISRTGFRMEAEGLDGDRCSKCGETIPLFLK